jgi:hypothetical protein
MSKTHYEVRVLCYRYNSGRGDNGNFIETIEFDNEAEARACAEKMKSWARYYDFEKREPVIPNEGAEFADDRYPCGGFIESIEGVFKVDHTETKL